MPATWSKLSKGQEIAKIGVRSHSHSDIYLLWLNLKDSCNIFLCSKLCGVALGPLRYITAKLLTERGHYEWKTYWCGTIFQRWQHLNHLHCNHFRNNFYVFLLVYMNVCVCWELRMGFVYMCVLVLFMVSVANTIYNLILVSSVAGKQ